MSQSLSTQSIRYPAAKPASKAPRNPDGMVEAAAGSIKVAPLVAKIPPTIPTRKPGRSAILIAMNPASTGIIKLKAKFPIFLNHDAIGVTLPERAARRLRVDTRDSIYQKSESDEYAARDDKRKHMRNSVHQMFVKFSSDTLVLSSLNGRFRSRVMINRDRAVHDFFQ